MDYSEKEFIKDLNRIFVYQYPDDDLKEVFLKIKTLLHRLNYQCDSDRDGVVEHKVPKNWDLSSPLKRKGDLLC